jgi:putative membrane protein
MAPARVRRNIEMALRHLLAGVAVVALMAPPALAQDSQQPQAQAEQMQVAQEDLDFAAEAAQGGLMEVRLGELAQQQAKSDEVKDFGQRMIQDHGEANAKLMQIAEQKGIELPQDLSEDGQETVEELQQLSGAEFDEAYMDEMVSDHEDDVAAFEDYIKNTQDPDLRSFAEETLATLQEHLDLAKQTQEQLAAAGDQEQPDPSMAAGEPTQEQPGEGQAGWVSLDEVLGSSVMNENGEEVGTIEDLVVKDEAHYAVLSVGGFLGIGEKEVAIPLDELKLGEDESYLMSAETEDQLEDLPEYEAAQYEPYQR